MASGITMLGLLTIVVFHVLLAQNQLALDRLERQTQAAEQRYAAERLEYAQLSSPQRIQQEAQQLGLTPPAEPPTSITVAGDVPRPPNATATTMNGWEDVKATLGTGP